MSKSEYKRAVKAFLVTDYTTTAEVLERVTPALAAPLWLSQLDSISPDAALDLDRKVAILRITFLATIVSSSPAPTFPSAPRISALAGLSAADLLRTLWAEAISLPPSSPPPQIFASPEAAFLHPSVVVALTLAALKLDDPRSARSILEAWFGSVSDEVDRVIWDQTSAPTFDWAEFGLDGDGGGGAGIMASTAGLKDVDPRRALVASWFRLYDLLTLHVLPRMGEWDAAGDFARGQSVENGGWVPESRVEESLARLAELQKYEILAASSKLQRERTLDSAKLEKAQRDAAEKARRRDVKGKGRAKTDDPPLETSTSLSSPEKPKPRPRLNGSTSSASSRSSSSNNSPDIPPPTPLPSPRGFAALRSHLSTYLVRTATSLPPSTTPPPIHSFRAYLRHHYTTDPVRLLTVVCFIFALSSWLRRTLAARRARGEVGLGLGGIAGVVRLAMGRVAETVRMGTTVTSL